MQIKLLGGTVPDTPIGVDAKLPTDPHLTLREKMGQVTTAALLLELPPADGSSRSAL